MLADSSCCVACLGHQVLQAPCLSLFKSREDSAMFSTCCCDSVTVIGLLLMRLFNQQLVLRARVVELWAGIWLSLTETTQQIILMITVATPYATNLACNI
jgi:hypothetical protein